MPAMSILIRLAKLAVRMVVMNKVKGRSGSTGPQGPVRAVQKVPGHEYLHSALRSHIALPNVSEFHRMLMAEGPSSGPPAQQMGGREDLSPEVLAGLAVVTKAAQDAAQRGDFAGMREVLHIGLKILTRLQQNRG